MKKKIFNTIQMLLLFIIPFQMTGNTKILLNENVVMCPISFNSFDDGTTSDPNCHAYALSFTASSTVSSLVINIQNLPGNGYSTSSSTSSGSLAWAGSNALNWTVSVVAGQTYTANLIYCWATPTEPNASYTASGCATSISYGDGCADPFVSFDPGSQSNSNCHGYELKFTAPSSGSIVINIQNLPGNGYSTSSTTTSGSLGWAGTNALNWTISASSGTTYTANMIYCWATPTTPTATYDDGNGCVNNITYDASGPLFVANPDNSIKLLQKENALKDNWADIEKDQFKVFPNPIKDGQLNVKIPEDLKVGSYQIMSLEGSIIKQGNLVELNNGLDFSNFSNNLYVLKITDKEGKILKVEKIMKF